MDKKNTLEQARERINRIDAEMAKLFEERMEAVGQVAAYKKSRGLPILDEKREAAVIARNSALVSDPALQPFYVQFLQQNMAVSRLWQSKLMAGCRVAFSGVPGAFAAAAASLIFPEAEAVPKSSFRAAYRAVEEGECDFAVLPIENSYNGDVSQVMDLAFAGGLHITGTYDLPVVHCLVAPEGATLSTIKTVISHEQALGQCADFIAAHRYESKQAVNTAVAAREVAERGDTTVAAIAGREAAELYGLTVLESHINESAGNTTRFAVFSRQAEDLSGGSDRHFILFFTVGNEAGCLSDAVRLFGERGFNLRALKSRPTKLGDWDYYFFVEGEGDIGSPEGLALIEELNKVCYQVKIAGSYRPAVLDTKHREEDR